MKDIVPALKKFCADTIEREKLPPPVKIELIGINPFYEMQATGKDAGEAWLFSRGDSVMMTLPQTLTVQFTVAGRRPFTRECRLTG